MLRPNPIVRLVADAPFDAGDVAANGHAHLSPEQRTRLQRQRTLHLGMWLALLSGWLLLTEALWLHPGLAAAGAAIIAAVLVLNLMRDHDDLSAPVMMAQGVVHIEASAWPRARLNVGGQIFNLPRRWQRLLTSGVVYRVYYTAGSRVLLSAEYAPVTHAPLPTRHVTGRFL